MLAALALLLTGGVYAQDFRPAGIGGAKQDDGAKANVEIVVSKKSVRPGETLDVAVKMTMKPGWHIYWKNPGDSGQPPKFTWNTPGGGASSMMRGSSWTAGDPQFPVPVRWQDAAGIVGYGYTGTVLFPATITVPGSTTPGQAAELGVNVSYLVCKDVCIPESATATVTFDVGADSGDEPTPAEKGAKKELETAKERLPTDPASPAKVTRDGQKMTVDVTLPNAGKNVNFFPDAPAGLSVEDVKVDARGPRVTVTFTAKRLQGIEMNAATMAAVIGYDAADGRRGVSVSVPLGEAK